MGPDNAQQLHLYPVYLESFRRACIWYMKLSPARWPYILRNPLVSAKGSTDINIFLKEYIDIRTFQERSAYKKNILQSTQREYERLVTDLDILTSYYFVGFLLFIA